MRFQQERTSAALAGTLDTMEPSPYGQRRPDAPWRSPRHETPTFHRWQLGDTFQIHVDGDLERRNGRPQRAVVDGYVKISANSMPLAIASVGVALQGGHFGSAGHRMISHNCQTSTPALRAARTTRVLDIAEVRVSHGGSPWVTA